ncbi:hypothetical protein BDR05DRAFT_785039 [Suillus weaverae]|nr:hypothetical protein BDR05DRAFT_785039 [Suillus weaverae]
MAGFLRKFRKNADVDHPAPSKPVEIDSPPSLPPLFARFATSSTLMESCVMPQDEWDPWKVLESTPPQVPQVPPQPPPQVPQVPPQPPPRAPQVPRVPLEAPPRRKYTGPGLPPLKLADPDPRAVPTRPTSPMTQKQPQKPGSSSSSSSNHTDATRFTSSSSAFTSTTSVAPAIKVNCLFVFSHTRSRELLYYYSRLRRFKTP